MYGLGVFYDYRASHVISFKSMKSASYPWMNNDEVEVMTEKIY